MNYWNFKNKLQLAFGIVFFVKHLTVAQYNTFSPYSRYGIGDLYENSSAYQKGMNNSGLALPIDSTAPAFINISNPAALSSARLTIIEATTNYYHSQILNKENYKVQNKSTNFNSLMIAFPVKKHSGFSFGLLPYSFVGYQINLNENINNIGNVNYVYDGSGGLNKVFAAYGFSLSKYFKPDTTHHFLKQLIKNLSLGINTQFIFGELAQTATVNYPNNTLYYNFVNDKRYRINGLTGDWGLQTFIRLNENKNILSIASVVSLPTQLNVINDYIAYNFSYNYYGEKYIVDTLLYSENKAGNLKLPLSTGIGIAFIEANKWGINSDFKFTNWKKFHLLNEASNVTNNFEINVGAFFQPDRLATSKNNYINKIIYRMGMGYNSGYQEYKGKPVPLYSFTAGVSLPMGLYRSFSAIHISAQFAIKGNKSFLLRENIFRINLGVTLNDRWFIKYKYD